jgi:hypothetical protein
MAFTAENLRDIAFGCRDLGTALSEFLLQDPDRAALTVAGALAAIEDPALAKWLREHPEVSGLKLPDLAIALADRSEDLAAEAVSEELQGVEEDGAALAEAAKEAAAAVEHIKTVQEFLTIAVAALGVATSVAAAIVAPSPASANAAVQAAKSLAGSFGPHKA